VLPFGVPELYHTSVYRLFAPRSRVPGRAWGAGPGRAPLYGAATLVLALTVFGRLPWDGLWADTLTNAAHGPAFFILTLVLIALLGRSRSAGVSGARTWVMALAVAILLGVLVELVQFVTGRDASMGDIWHDTIGAATAVGLVAALRRPDADHGRRTRWAGLVVAVLGVMAMLAPVALTAAAYLHRWHSFPLLADPGSALYTYFLGTTPNLAVERVALPSHLIRPGEGRRGVRVRITDDAYWQLALREPVADWRGHHHLNVDLANPTSEPLRVVLRLFDRPAGESGTRPGFRGVLLIAPHSRRITRIPLADIGARTDGAPIDLARVHSVVIARTRANRAREFFLAGLWLD